jgi:hypothetical protein
VIVLDENIFAGQRAQLRNLHMSVHQIGYDVGRKGMSDEEILPLLRRLRRPTFLTRDPDFFDKRICSDRYCLAYLDVQPAHAAQYIRRFLRQPNFKSWTQRKGCVIRVAAAGVSVWRIRAPRVARYQWIA